MSKGSIVICRLPDAGLGNQLFPLLKSKVFAELNDLPLIVLGSGRFRIGPYLRGERVKRNYRGYFNFQKSFWGYQLERLSLLKYAWHTMVAEPPVERIDPAQKEGKKFYFSAVPHWSDYFAGLREHRQLAIRLFWSLVRDPIKDRLERLAPSPIGIHIRMGDFRKLAEGEDFKKVGAVRTPESYFTEVLSGIRQIHGSDLPALVFTDGYRTELEKIFSFANTAMAEGNPDIVDMLLLSRSRVIVASAGSTFSYWSAFLSDAAVVLHPDHLHASIRPWQINTTWYEGPLYSGTPDPLFKANILNI